ncbi:MAG: DNA-primase RepB domain-containing protein [Burkholderiales bacterium]
MSAAPNPFSGLMVVQKARDAATLEKMKKDHQNQFEGSDGSALRIWNELVDQGAASWLKLLQFLHSVVGESEIDVCYMRRELVRGLRVGDRGPTFAMAGRGALTVLSLTDIIDKPARLRRWVMAGAMRRQPWNKAYSKEAELHMRLTSRVRSVVMVDDVPEAQINAIRRSGLWRVVLETSQDNFQVLLLLPEAAGADARQAAQASIASVLGGDPGSTAADKWHRAPGSKNDKAGPDGKGVNWICQLRDCCEGAPLPMAWLPARWPTVVAAVPPVPEPSTDAADAAIAQRVEPEVAQQQHHVWVLLVSIDLPPGMSKIGNPSVREFAIAAEYLKRGASLSSVVDHVEELAAERDKYKKVRGGAMAYALRTLAGVLAEFEISAGAPDRRLFVMHSTEARRLGCRPDDFPKARQAAARRAARPARS